jgi:dCTP deaminase
MADQKKDPNLFLENPITGVLGKKEIEEMVAQNRLIGKATFSAACLEASSYDVRVGGYGILGGEGKVQDLKQEPLELPPGGYCGVISREKLLLLADVCARIGPKRSMSYDGIILLTGAIVDPGYEGHLLLGLYNASHRRVHIRYERKICNIVFEQLARKAEKLAPVDPSLRDGILPDAFVDKMGNMEVLPWMQITERVKQIEQITADILDLKARYDDVLQPIKKLTENIEDLTKDVNALTGQTRNLATDVDRLNGLVGENAKQISQMVVSLATVGERVATVSAKSSDLEKTTNKLQTTFGKFQILAYIIWGLVIFFAGFVLQKLFFK